MTSSGVRRPFRTICPTVLRRKSVENFWKLGVPSPYASPAPPRPPRHREEGGNGGGRLRRLSVWKTAYPAFKAPELGTCLGSTLMIPGDWLPYSPRWRRISCYVVRCLRGSSPPGYRRELENRHPNADPREPPHYRIKPFHSYPAPGPLSEDRPRLLGKSNAWKRRDPPPVFLPPQAGADGTGFGILK